MRQLFAQIGSRVLFAWIGGLVMVLLAGNLAAQANKQLSLYARDVWTTREGLPHNQVNSVAQTSEGYLWLATWEGLVRYNGREFQTYMPNNLAELDDHGVRSVSVDSTGMLIVSTSRGGITTLANGQWKHFSIAEGLAQEEVMQAIRDRQQRFWIAHESAGVVRLDTNGEAERFTVEDGLPSDRMFAITEDSAGVIWVGTDGGLARIEQNRITNFDAESGLPPGIAIYSLRPMVDGRLLVGTHIGLYVGSNGRFALINKNFPQEVVASIAVDGDGGILAGTVNRGIIRVVGDQIETYDSSAGLPNNRVPALFVDREGSIWAGTNAGLSKFSDAPFVTFDTFHGLADNYVRTVLETADGSILIGSSRGLDRWKDGVFQPVARNIEDGIGNEAVLSLTNAANGDVWVGMYAGGLMRLSGGKVVERLSDTGSGRPVQVRAIIEMPDGVCGLVPQQVYTGAIKANSSDLVLPKDCHVILLLVCIWTVMVACGRAPPMVLLILMASVLPALIFLVLKMHKMHSDFTKIKMAHCGSLPIAVCYVGAVPRSM